MDAVQGAHEKDRDGGRGRGIRMESGGDRGIRIGMRMGGGVRVGMRVRMKVSVRVRATRRYTKPPILIPDHPPTHRSAGHGHGLG